MVDRFYIKTGGPIPEGCNMTERKCPKCSRVWPHPCEQTICIEMYQECMVCRFSIGGAGTQDELLEISMAASGNPVPAPWEEAAQDAAIYGQGFVRMSAESVEHIAAAEVLAQPGKALAEAAKQAYLLLLKIRSEDRYTPDYQYTLCALRDQIAGYEGRSAEDVQNDYESQALAAYDQDRGKEIKT